MLPERFGDKVQMVEADNVSVGIVLPNFSIFGMPSREGLSMVEDFQCFYLGGFFERDDRKAFIGDNFIGHAFDEGVGEILDAGREKDALSFFNNPLKPAVFIRNIIIDIFLLSKNSLQIL